MDRYLAWLITDELLNPGESIPAIFQNNAPLKFFKILIGLVATVLISMFLIGSFLQLSNDKQVLPQKPTQVVVFLLI